MPDVVTAGCSWQWDLALSDYDPAGGWAASMALVGPERRVEIAATAADGVFQFRAAAANTDVPAGRYKWAVFTALGAERHLVASGVLTVQADLAEVDDARSHEEKCIPLLETAIQTRVTADLKQYTVTQRAATKEELLQMEALLRRYRAIVWRQRNPGRLGPQRSVRFVQP